MFIAHMPAGYLLTRRLLENHTLNRYVKPNWMGWLLLGLVASVLPDFDLLYFYFIDNRQHNHHTYWMHWPLFWLGCTSVLLLTGLAFRWRWLVKAAVIVGMVTQLHMALDTVAGGIMWLAPLSHESFVLVTVENRYQDWVHNFLLHWTFLLELLIVFTAGWKFIHQRRISKRNGNPPF